MKDSNWISVKDKLPEDYDAYLCTGGDIEMEIIYFDPEFGWQEEYGITHWMNLPELPEVI